MDTTRFIVIYVARDGVKLSLLGYFDSINFGSEPIDVFPQVVCNTH